MYCVNGIMCITNNGILERGWLDGGNWYTIDNITVKMSNGKRLKRYAVCENGTWKSNQTMTLREARTVVEELRDKYRRYNGGMPESGDNGLPMTAEEMITLLCDYAPSLKVAYTVHDTEVYDGDCKYTLSYNGIIVGSELVSAGYVRDNIERYLRYKGVRK